MTIGLSHFSSWIWLAAGLVILFVVFRFFSHIVVRIFHFIMSFFWHGCITIIVLFIIYYILRAMGIL
jgi:hypothetical protein